MESKSRRPAKGWKQPLWERQTGETDKAFQAFGIYRDMGPGRSMEAVGKAQGKSRKSIEPWSVTWGWGERASAWDDECDRNQRKRDELERAQTLRKMREGHVKAGQAMQQVAGLALQKKFTEESAGSAKNLEDLSAGDIARLMDTGVKLELRARGEATERVEMREAIEWVERFVDVAMDYVPLDMQDAFLADVRSKIGAGA